MVGISQHMTTRHNTPQYVTNTVDNVAQLCYDFGHETTHRKYSFPNDTQRAQAAPGIRGQRRLFNLRRDPFGNPGCCSVSAIRQLCKILTETLAWVSSFRPAACDVVGHFFHTNAPWVPPGPPRGPEQGGMACFSYKNGNFLPVSMIFAEPQTISNL